MRRPERAFSSTKQIRNENDQGLTGGVTTTGLQDHVGNPNDNLREYGVIFGRVEDWMRIA